MVVPNDQLSLAIGRQGQNVRLASKLIGWRIDVKSEQRYANLQEPSYQSLLKLKGVDETLADQLLGKGIFSTAVLATKSLEDLTVLRAIDDEFAQALIDESKANPFEPEEALDATAEEVESGDEQVSEDEQEVTDAEGDKKDAAEETTASDEPTKEVHEEAADADENEKVAVDVEETHADESEES